MPVVFNKAPLVELVAELQWTPQLSLASDMGGTPSIPQYSDPSESDAFIQRFGAAVYEHGFKQMERLMPFGAMLPQGVIAARYRHENQQETPVLTQVGPSIFSVNALPPYKSWSEFRPWIQCTVASLLGANPSIQQYKVVVRYMDAFKGDLLEGQDMSDFIENTLGFSLQIPPALNALKVADKKIRSNISAVIPMNEMQMTVKVGEGKVSGEAAAIMDTAVAVSDEVPADVDAILDAMDRARRVIHDSFVEITRPISELLEPQGDDG